MHARNTIFSIIVCLFLLGPCGLWLAQNSAKIDLPEWLDTEDAKYLAGGEDTANLRENLTLSGFVSEELQGALSVKIEDNVPFRSFALLSNAALQRAAIHTSNLVFNYLAYPTFFGSSYCYLPMENGIMRMPAQNSQSLLDDVSLFVDGINAAAERHPDIAFNVCITDLSSYSAVNPAMPLVSKPTATAKDIIGAIRNSINRTNIHVVDVAPESTEEYFHLYYTSDHHWSGYGALRAFQALTKSTVSKTSAQSSVPILRTKYMNGSSSRGGLMLLNERDAEPQLDLRDIEASAGYDAVLKSNDLEAALDDNPLLAEFDFYHTWYGPSANTTITNKRASDAALLIGDSYTSAMQWLIARDYHRTSVFLDCHGAYKGSETLEDRIAESGCKDVYFVMAPTGIQYLKECYPRYWSTSE